MLTQKFAGKVALVTGSGSGIGRATALAFAEAGAQVIVADISIEGGEETMQMIRDRGGEARFVRTDVSKAAEVAALIDKTVATYGRLDYAHNNAGISGNIAPTADYSEDDWDQVMAVNLKGIWLCMKYEIPQLLKQEGGAIVNTASIAGLVGVPGIPAYVASKHGINGLTKTAALEYAKTGLRINAICPGAIRTAASARFIELIPGYEAQIQAQEPIGRIGQPEEVATAVLWLCSAEASFVTGSTMTIDGGWTAQ